MRWKSLLKHNGKPTLFEAFEKGFERPRFCIERVGRAVYLQDMRKDKIPYPSYNFDTVENAKAAVNDHIKNGTKLKSNCEDPFAGLSKAVRDADKFLKKLGIKYEKSTFKES